MLNIFVVGFGGFIGAVLRYMIGLIPINEVMIFPIKTFIINIIGCIAIGINVVSTIKSNSLSPHMLLFLKVGLCGGFTTFSTFALETADLMKTGHMGAAFLYVIFSAVVGVAVIFLVEYFV